MKKDISLKIFSILSLFFFPLIISFGKILIYIFKIYKNNYKWINIEIAIIISFIGALFPSKGDVLVYSEAFEYIKQLDLFKFVEFLRHQSDYIFYILEYIFVKLRINFQIFQFIIILFGNILWMNLLTRAQEKLPNEKYFFLCIFLLFNLPIYFLYRSMIASVILGYGVYNFLNKKKNYLGYIILSILWHKSMILLLGIFFIGYIFRKKSQWKLFIISLLIGLALYNLILSCGEYMFPRFYKYYIAGYWNREFLNNMNINGKIAFFLPPARYICIISIYIVYIKRLKKIFNIGIALGILILFYFISLIGFIRILYGFSIIVFLVYIFEIEDKKEISKFLKKIIIVVFIFCYILQLIEFQEFIFNINYFNLFFGNAFMNF